MKPTLTNTSDREAIIRRLVQLQPDSLRQWGRMSVGQMLAHCAEPIRITLGEKPGPFSFPAPVRYVAGRFFLWTNRMGKSMTTLPELDAEKGRMTPPTDFESDRQTLLAYVNRFASLPESGRYENPAFGRLTAREFGQITHLHLNHHLRQFGV